MNRFILLTRMWINQPSTLQPLHKLHGTKVLARILEDNTTDVYFLSGDTVSARVPRNTLSHGWSTENEN